MKKAILSLILFISALSLNAQVVKFKGSYEQALAEAKRTNKLLMFMASATW